MLARGKANKASKLSLKRKASESSLEEGQSHGGPTSSKRGVLDGQAFKPMTGISEETRSSNRQHVYTISYRLCVWF